MEIMEPALAEILGSGTVDWVLAAEVLWHAKQQGGAMTDDEARRVILRILKHALDEGLIEVGDVGEGGFRRWNLSNAETLERVDAILRERKDGLISEFWLNNTDKGDRLGLQVIEAQQQGKRA